MADRKRSGVATQQQQQEDPTSKEQDEEDIVTRTIGAFGRWQLTNTFLLSLFNIPCTWHIFAPTFHAAERDTWCARPAHLRNVAPTLWKNLTQLPNDFCHVRDVLAGNFSDSWLSLGPLATEGVPMIKCTDWEFGGEGETITSEFHLVCDRKTLNNLSEMMFLAGVAIGGLVCGILSDRYGRKRMLMTSVLIQTIIGTAVAFAPWFELYVALRACLGFISVSVVFSGFVLAIELVDGKWRTVAGISYLFPVSLSYMTIAGMGWLLSDWRQLQLALSLPGLFFLGLWWILPESPRWLLAMGRTKELILVLNEAAKTNGKPLPDNLDKFVLPSGAGAEESTDKAGVMDLFKTFEMRKRTFLSFLIWFSTYLVYYGLVLNLGNIGGNLYVNSVLIGAVEIPAIAISIVILIRGGRRWPLAGTMIISGVACGLTIPIDLTSHLQWVITTLTMISKFSISSSNAIMPVFTAELYPTTIRNVGVGAANVSAGIALMLVPYLWELVSIHPTFPMSMIAGFGIVGGAAVLYLPETGYRPLKPDMRTTNAGELRRINNNCQV